MTRLQIGISMPWDLPTLAPDAQRTRMAAIADAGIDHVFTADHVSFIDGSGIDGPVRLAALGAMEPRLGLHLGVMLLALRHPVVAARQISTLAELAPGRVSIGVGVGGEDRHEFEVCGIDPATRGRRTDAALDIVRRLLDGETVDGDGEFFEFEQARIRPSPRPRVPFVVGGRSNAALDRAGRLGDGWLAAWCSPRRFQEATARVESVGVDREVDWRHGLQTWVGVGADREEARTHVAAGMSDFYGMPFEPFEKYTPFGTADDIVAFVEPYLEAGMSSISFTPCGPDGETELAVMAEVAGRLRGE